MKYFAAGFFFILSTVCMGQDYKITGNIFDKNTKAPLPYSTIEVPAIKSGTISDSTGNFQIILNNSISGSYVYFSALGYLKDSIVLSDAGSEKNLSVGLVPKVFDIDEITVFPGKYKVKTLGITKAKNNQRWNYGLPTLQRAIFIENKDYAEDFFIGKISVYIDTIGFPEAPLRVHLYSLDKENNIPGSDLLNENIFIRNAKGGDFVSLDLSHKNIRFPQEGVYVGIEWIYENDDYYYIKSIRSKDSAGEYYSADLKGYGPTLGIVTVKDKSQYWKKLVGADWENNSSRSKNIHPIINVELIKYKD